MAVHNYNYPECRPNPDLNLTEGAIVDCRGAFRADDPSRNSQSAHHRDTEFTASRPECRGALGSGIII